jgi:hypothetical protein
MLKGTLDDFTLPDVFRLMSFAKKTGRLDIVRSAGQGMVFFREGEVYFAESSLSKEPLGQKLVRARAITDGQLMKALDQHAASGKRLGAVLIESGLVTEDQLTAALHQQIEDSIFDLLRWELGEFAWEPGDQRDVEVPISVSVENLIMEASRRLDEYEVIRRKIPSGNAVLGMAATPPEGAVEINITPDEWRILVLVDGQRTVSDIAQMVGLDEFGAMRVLYGLVSAGLIELISEGDEMGPVAPSAPAAPAVEVPTAESPPEREPIAEPIAVIEPEPIVEPEPVLEPDALVEPEQMPAAAADAEAATAAAVEPEPPAAAEPVQADVDAAAADVVELDAPAELAISPDIAEDIFAAIQDDDETAVTTAEEAAGDGAGAEIDVDALDSFGVEPLEAEGAAVASLDDAAWEEPAIDSFDAPQPNELVTETPSADPFLDDLMSQPSASADQPPPAPPGPADDIPASSAPAGEAPSVDRAAVVRELAGLFDDDGPPKARPAAPRPKAEGDDEDARKRVEDDEQVTKGIISRLIDGVKGL